MKEYEMYKILVIILSGYGEHRNSSQQLIEFTNQSDADTALTSLNKAIRPGGTVDAHVIKLY